MLLSHHVESTRANLSTYIRAASLACQKLENARGQHSLSPAPVFDRYELIVASPPTLRPIITEPEEGVNNYYSGENN